MIRAATMPALSPAAQEALATLQRQHERSETAQDGLTRAIATDRVGKALKATGGGAGALLTLWAIRRRSIADIAELTGKSQGEIADRLGVAATALARHFETVAADES